MLISHPHCEVPIQDSTQVPIKHSCLFLFDGKEFLTSFGYGPFVVICVAHIYLTFYSPNGIECFDEHKLLILS